MYVLHHQPFFFHERHHFSTYVTTNRTQVCSVPQDAQLVSLYFCVLCDECQKRDARRQREMEKEWLRSCRRLWLIWHSTGGTGAVPHRMKINLGFCPIAIVITDSLIQSVIPIIPTRTCEWNFHLPPFVSVIHVSIFPPLGWKYFFSQNFFFSYMWCVNIKT